MGSRPMRDISSPSPDLADDLPAHALTPRLAVRQDALRRREDAHAEAAPDRGDLALSDVDAQARPADPPDAGDDGPASLVVAQSDAQHGERFLLDQRGVGEV